MTVCKSCAIANGAKPHETHVSSYWVGECSLCSEIKKVCSFNDWCWLNENETDETDETDEAIQVKE